MMLFNTRNIRSNYSLCAPEIPEFSIQVRVQIKIKLKQNQQEKFNVEDSGLE